MNQKEIWAQLVERHPDFCDENHIVKLRARGLKSLIDQAWEEGRIQGIADEKKEIDRVIGGNNPFSSFFK